MIATFSEEALDELCELPDKKIAEFMRMLTFAGILEQERMERLFSGKHKEKMIDILRKVKLPDEEINLSEE